MKKFAVKLQERSINVGELPTGVDIHYFGRRMDSYRWGQYNGEDIKMLSWSFTNKIKYLKDDIINDIFNSFKVIYQNGKGNLFIILANDEDIIALRDRHNENFGILFNFNNDFIG